MAVLISFVRLSSSLPPMGKEPTFLGVGNLTLMAYSTHDMGLVAFFINGAAHGFAVNCETLILLGVGLVPALKGTIQIHRVNPDENITDNREAWDYKATLFTAAVETFSGLLAKTVCPIGDGLISTHSTQYCPCGNGKHCGNRMSAALSASWIRNVCEEIRKG